MFYKMITKKRDEWFTGDCVVKELIEYIEKTNQMRDAQVDAIKTYLFLKIACDNKPLFELFKNGVFNTLDLDELEVSSSVRTALQNKPALAALYEYASLKDDSGNQVSEKICKEIKRNPESIDAREFFKNAFYGVTYTDYLFSLPMGAGKTYLMAAFVYLDLYFAINEPNNPNFAHNFIIFAPSGLKSSVVPSLRTIQNFVPSWVIPEPVASELKRMLIFEVLDENKTAKKSNKTKNPNVQKIAIHQPLTDLMGLVAVTNAEKVILDRVEEKNGQISLFEESDDEKDKQANELRNLLDKLPHLSIFIDEVHHAATDEKKLRAVVNKWAQGGNVNSVIGFSGTPYLQTREKIAVTSGLSVATQEISNIVYYYPLVDGIGNFLKKPKVFISSSNDRLDIIENGVKEFLNSYKDTIYADGTFAKLGIYCGTIETLEEKVYPLVEKLVVEYGLNPSIAILKYHGGNKNYPIPVDSAYEFSILDKAFSQKRIILLVQIGKEGWDCRSLTGIILSQEGDCSTNMVLQTSCRCLRQVQKGVPETAMIYLNNSNANTLNLQLEQQHRINIQEFQNGKDEKFTLVKRYDRSAYLRLPKVDFYQLKVNYKTVVVQKVEDVDIRDSIKLSVDIAKRTNIIKTAEMSDSLQTTETKIDDKETGTTPANFNIWINDILKESFNSLDRSVVIPYLAELKEVFDKITYKKDDVLYFSSKFDLAMLNAHMRKSFYDKHTFETQEELIPEEASLLHVDNFKAEVYTKNVADYYPKADMVEKIILDDNGELKLDKKNQQMYDLAVQTGNDAIIDFFKKQMMSHPMKDKSFHYLPYKTDSSFEQKFLEEVLTESVIKDNNLEVYYNGDRALTEFKIKCYQQVGKKCNYIGMYTPDFLIIKRKDGKIHKALIVETKGKIYANDQTFKQKRNFMESAFIKQNNDKFGYNRFDYLYLEDTIEEKDRIVLTLETIKKFFAED